jgi:hypothetical protein
MDLNVMGYGPMVGFCEDDKYGVSLNNSNLIFIVISSFFTWQIKSNKPQ